MYSDTDAWGDAAGIGACTACAHVIGISDAWTGIVAGAVVLIGRMAFAGFKAWHLRRLYEAPNPPDLKGGTK